MVIRWNQTAIKQLEKIIDYIREDSISNAISVEDAILSKIDGLLKYPEIYPPDKYKTMNDGSFRAFEIYHYRIAYRIKKNEIRISRIRHTKRNPLKY